MVFFFHRPFTQLSLILFTLFLSYVMTVFPAVNVFLSNFQLYASPSQSGLATERLVTLQVCHIQLFIAGAKKYFHILVYNCKLEHIVSYFLPFLCPKLLIKDHQLTAITNISLSIFSTSTLLERKLEDIYFSLYFYSCLGRPPS